MPGTSFSAHFKEVARQMAANPGLYPVFGNAEKILPKAKRGEFYIEAQVPFGIATGTGQYRVVCLCFQSRGNIVVLKKYYSKTHYGTGQDAGKRPDFVEFQ